MNTLFHFTVKMILLSLLFVKVCVVFVIGSFSFVEFI